MHASRKCCTQHQRKLCHNQSFCMCESQEYELKENNINGLIQLLFCCLHQLECSTGRHPFLKKWITHGYITEKIDCHIIFYYGQ